MNGITRGKVIEAAERMGIVCKQKNFSLYDVYDADEAFVTGTFGGLTPVVSIDGRDISNGYSKGLTQKLHLEYEALINEQIGND